MSQLIIKQCSRISYDDKDPRVYPIDNFYILDLDS